MSRARLSKTKQLESFYLKNAKETMKNSIQHAINLYSIGTIVQYNTVKDLLNNLTSLDVPKSVLLKIIDQGTTSGVSTIIAVTPPEEDDI